MSDLSLASALVEEAIREHLRVYIGVREALRTDPELALGLDQLRRTLHAVAVAMLDRRIDWHEALAVVADTLSLLMGEEAVRASLERRLAFADACRALERTPLRVQMLAPLGGDFPAVTNP